MSDLDGPAGGVRGRSVPALAAVSATIYGLAGLGLFLSGMLHTDDMNPRWLLLTLSAIAMAFGATALVRGRSFTVLEAELMVAVGVAVIVALTVGTRIDVAALGDGAGLPLIAIYAGWFLTLRGRLIVGAGALGWLGAVAARGEGVLTSIAAGVAVESLIAAEIVRLLVRRMQSLAETDPLTGALNRHGLKQAWSRLAAPARHRGSPLSLAVIDVDGLREVDNRHGHRAGDQLLVRAARQWQTQLPRPAAVAPARWSAGVAEVPPGASLDQVVDRADRLMYNRKGGNGAAWTEGAGS